jgi:hypothetical protein
MARRADLHVQGSGSVYLLRPVSRCGTSWVAEHIPSDAMRFAGGSIVVEHRYIHDIVAAAIADGLRVTPSEQRRNQGRKASA